MRYGNKIVLVLFILILISALFFNIIIRSKTDTGTIDIELNAVYFDLSLIQDKELASKIDNFIRSNNKGAFKKIITKKDNEAAKFYAFCGLLNIDQKEAGRYLNKFLSNENKIDIILDESITKKEYPVGYAVILLLNDLPKNLITNNPNDDFFSNIQDSLENAYNSKIAEDNPDYKKILFNLILKKNEKLTENLLENLLNNESAIKNMTVEEKVNVSLALKSLPKDNKEKIIKILSNEANNDILINVLESIDENDTEKVARLTLKIFYDVYSKDIKILAMEKYGLILKSDSLDKIQSIMRSTSDFDIRFTGLNLIKDYGDSSFYDYLKTYLKTSYPENINLAALEAIVNTTYKDKPEDVLNTMSFILRNIQKEKLAYYAVKFHVDNSIKINSSSIIYRLKQMESKRMKELALVYVDKFKPDESVSLLEELANDSDDKIRLGAKELLKNFE